MKIAQVKLASIHVATTRLRQVDDQEARRIAASMSELGQITPIEVAPMKNGVDAYLLVSGAHRMRAATLLGWAEITATIVSSDADTIMLREIDENLARVELSPYDQAEFITMRWRIWLRRHDKRASLADVLELPEGINNQEFYDETAGLSGLNQETIRLAVRRRRHLNEVWGELRHTDAAKSGKLLDRLRKHKNPALIRDIVTDALSNNGSIDEAIERHKFRKPRNVPSAKSLLKALEKAWNDCPKAQREQFVARLQKSGEL